MACLECPQTDCVGRRERKGWREGEYMREVRDFKVREREEMMLHEEIKRKREMNGRRDNVGKQEGKGRRTRDVMLEMMREACKGVEKKIEGR